jgi:hypothetical protein
VFVAEKPSRKTVVRLQSAPDSTRIQRTGRLDLPTPFTFHLMDFQNRYPIINVAPHCVAIERLHVASSQLWTREKKTVPVAVRCERLTRAV